MPPKPIIDLSRIDFTRTVFGPDEIRERNAQRFEMEMLHRIVHHDRETGEFAAVREVAEGEFWARGHFPKRAVFPGVLMIESAGQLCSFAYGELFANKTVVMGFAACDEVKFRGTVEPGDTLRLLAVGDHLRPRIARFRTQGLVGDEIVFEGQITGMPLSI